MAGPELADLTGEETVFHVERVEGTETETGAPTEGGEVVLIPQDDNSQPEEPSLFERSGYWRLQRRRVKIVR